ncbi:MAG: hypothetical protein KBT11_05700 [Treponema sp.]|nr:hypothetical protein [Candidatus Treponema equifaecale]
MQNQDLNLLESNLQEFKQGRTYRAYKLQFPELYNALENLELSVDQKDFELVYRNFSDIFNKLNLINSESANMSFVFTFIIAVVTMSFIFICIFWNLRQKGKTQILNAMAETEKERTRLARELHDSIIQDLRALEFICEKNEAQKPIAKELSKVQASIRSICADLNPPGLDFEDFDCMIFDLCRNFETQTGISCKCNLPEANVFNFLDISRRLNLYRIIQEVLNNSKFHSECTRCSLLARKKSEQGFVLYINDNGKGFDVNEIKFNKNSHFGLSGIKQRAAIMDAKLEITSSPEDGTQFRLEI